MTFYFSGTGNPKWVTEQTARVQNEALVFMPNAIKGGIEGFVLADNEKVGLIFPVYSRGPLLAVLQFLDWVTLADYHSQYTYFMCSCGDDTGSMERVLCGALSRKGIECNAGFSVTIPNNYVLLPGLDADKRELEKEKLKKAVDRVEEVNYLINARETGFHCNEGSSPWLKTEILSSLFNCFMTSAGPFHVTDDCIDCERCERVYPVGNVAVVGWGSAWGMDYTSCLACCHVCPKHAVQYGKGAKSKG